MSKNQDIKFFSREDTGIPANVYTSSLAEIFVKNVALKMFESKAIQAAERKRVKLYVDHNSETVAIVCEGSIDNKQSAEILQELPLYCKLSYLGLLEQYAVDRNSKGE